MIPSEYGNNVKCQSISLLFRFAQYLTDPLTYKNAFFIKSIIKQLILFLTLVKQPERKYPNLITLLLLKCKQM